MTVTVIPTVWQGCYDKQLGGFITRKSFRHPAKFSLGLIERIFDHCLERGYLQRGDLVADCFGGVAVGGIVAAYRGLRWIGVELEPDFVELAKENIALHAGKLEQLGFPIPQIVQGDSRRFHAVVEGVCGVVTSPPFVSTGVKDHSGQTDALLGGRFKGGGDAFLNNEYGSSKGQIGNMKPGDVDAIVTSPPFGERKSYNDGDKARNLVEKLKANNPEIGGANIHQAAGESPGNISTLEAGPLTAVVTSPPYEGTAVASYDGSMGEQFRTTGKTPRQRSGGKLPCEQYNHENESNIGNQQGETYWQAMLAVYQSCFTAIKSSGFIVVVVKDYVKNKQRVHLCDDTARLLQHVGFTVLERIHASLVAQTTHADLFTGETVTTKSRKSFFRRLAEKKGSPRIDYEEVIFARKLP